MKTNRANFDEAYKAVDAILNDKYKMTALAVMERILAILQEKGISMDMDAIPLNDRKTYDFLHKGETKGIYLFEIPHVGDIISAVLPDSFEDLIMVVALSTTALSLCDMDDLIERKKGTKPVEYAIPRLKGILDETYGFIMYHEQILSILSNVGGLTEKQAAMLKKEMIRENQAVFEGMQTAEQVDETYFREMRNKFPIIVKYKNRFIRNVSNKDITAKEAAQLFEYMAHCADKTVSKAFAEYHTRLAYCSAYLKAHYALEFRKAYRASKADMGLFVDGH
jgi:DNA polymerase-3 subunit alpha